MNTNDIVDVEVDDVFSWDYPDFADAYVSYAVWEGSGKELTENELEQLNDKHGEFVHEKAHESVR